MDGLPHRGDRIAVANLRPDFLPVSRSPAKSWSPTFWCDNNPAINSITYEMGILTPAMGSELFPSYILIHVKSIFLVIPHMQIAKQKY
jgi:hypothetical protein